MKTLQLKTNLEFTNNTLFVNFIRDNFIVECKRQTSFFECDFFAEDDEIIFCVNYSELSNFYKSVGYNNFLNNFNGTIIIKDLKTNIELSKYFVNNGTLTILED